MRKKAEDLLLHLEEKLSYFSELGAEFIFNPEKRKDEILAALHHKILTCTLCPLSRERTQAVPGEGNFATEIMFVGEAPGADEDAQGRPFVGKAGQLLTRIIQAMKFSREEVFITNVVKCRPPQNRTPLRSEVEECQVYLLGQIETIEPKVIVALGKVAADFFIPSGLPMTRMRGDFHEFGKILIMPTFHPAYIIRNEGNKQIKKLVWEDMKKVMAASGRK